ncbi:MAG: hypothetical protein ACYDBJ_27265 [Aggregatilineales bacterium]
MPETKMIAFSYKEVAEALLKGQDIHEGLWGVYIEFGIGAANVAQTSADSIVPAAIVPVVKIGLQRFTEPNNLTVDAATVNPIKQSKK